MMKGARGGGRERRRRRDGPPMPGRDAGRREREYEEFMAAREFEEMMAAREFEEMMAEREFEEMMAEREFEEMMARREFEEMMAREMMENDPRFEGGASRFGEPHLGDPSEKPPVVVDVDVTEEGDDDDNEREGSGKHLEMAYVNGPPRDESGERRWPSATLEAATAAAAARASSHAKGRVPQRGGAHPQRGCPLWRPRQLGLHQLGLHQLEHRRPHQPV